MENRQIIQNLGDVTDLSDTFLERLPEDRLSHYFDRSAQDASPRALILHEIGSAASAFAALIGFTTGNPVLGVGLLSLTAYFGKIAGDHESGVKTNKDLAQEIKHEVYEVIGQSKYPSFA